MYVTSKWSCKMIAVLGLLFDLSPMNKFIYLVISWYCVSLTLDRGGGGDISSDGFFYKLLKPVVSEVVSF